MQKPGDPVRLSGFGSCSLIPGGSPEQSMELACDQEQRSGADPLKSCADCSTTKTPLWRAGPSGPKSLCNACGIRYQKSRKTPTPAPALAGEDRWGKNMGVAVVLKQRRRSWIQRRRRRIVGEVEQAAFLLMALSSGLLLKN